jgi:hypothetical protein
MGEERKSWVITRVSPKVQSARVLFVHSLGSYAYLYVSLERFCVTRMENVRRESTVLSASRKLSTQDIGVTDDDHTNCRRGHRNPDEEDDCCPMNTT